MEQVIFELERGAVIGGVAMFFGILTYAELRERVLLPWAASLLGRHQGEDLRDHTEGF